ncbi:Fibronectin type-III repeats protein [Croceitalea dokdonensis DOKDO 023]|uniref:Fibronectin type-III repeats protein n=1 Tax=Croceitalea dokdonensis DOKDO 023 TaxID=1300341 RepID=A0A0P7AWE8_9FLAO|nr:hypothetical protein [Croceitalea dokdonensis]KPM32318.1 Fibronectin type-III repeats protein [Croceitalea dokdonensis DOKDO 023]
MKKLALLMSLLVLLSCGKDDGPPPGPSKANLLFPIENSECTTGVEVGQNKSRVTFEWEAAANTDIYTLNVLNLVTNIPQEISTAQTAIALEIEKGTPFSWSVRTQNEETEEIITSDVWLFYNAGAQTSYAPFPARILSPESGTTLQASAENTVMLRWQGADVEDDITEYRLYFGETNPPTVTVATLASNEEEFMVDVNPGTVYFWKIISLDAKGNTSDSGVFDFKVL